MKLTFIVILCCLIQVSASTYSQNTKLNISMENAKFKQLLRNIKGQSKFTFVFNVDDVEKLDNINCNFEEATVEEVLDHCFEGTKMTYEIRDRVIIITPKEEMINPELLDQDLAKNRVSGRVVDKEGVPLPGVTVSVKGNAFMGTITDDDGNFLMSNVDDKAILLFSFIGMEPVEVPVSKLDSRKRKNIKVEMFDKNTGIEEVVVTGHATQRKVSVTGSIASVEPESLKSPTRSMSTQLAGAVAGVSFTQSSGQPGKDGAQFTIRGITSVVGNTDPLVLIDGFKRTLDDVDPNDVESFSVLKDASATAIYGLEGANGILVITTKTGNASSKPRVRFSYSSSMNSPTFKPEWLQSPEYAEIYNEARAVRGYDPVFTDEMIQMFGDDDNDFYPNTDWYDQLVNSAVFSQKANLNLSGGSNAVTYYLSGGFYNETGMFNAKIGELDANSNFNQFNFRSNIQADLTPTTTINLGLNGRYGITREPGIGTSDILNNLYSINPTLFPHEYSTGEIPLEPSGTANQWAVLTRKGYREEFSNRMSTNLDLTQNLDFITKGLFAKVMTSFSNDASYQHFYEKNYQVYEIDYANSYMFTGRDENGNLLTKPWLDESGNTVNEDVSFRAGSIQGGRVIELQGTLNYKRSFAEKWHLAGLILYKQRSSSAANPSGSDATLLINSLPVKTQSIAGRVSVDYKHRYFADVSYGLSGSQMFTPDKRFSPFPSFGLGWLMSDEGFFAGLKNTVNLLKVRASYGIVGSSGSASRFGYLSQTGGYNGYTFGFGYQFGSEYIGGLGQTQVPQYGLTWERVYKKNIAVEMELFNNLKIIAELFEDRREDQLVSLYNIPATLGLPGDRPQANLGEMRSKGVDLDITYRKSWNNFRINAIKLIAGYNENKIIEDGKNDPNMEYQSALGLDYGRQLRLVALGLFKDQAEIDASPVQVFANEVLPGDIKYKDINGDGFVNSEDKIWVGNQYPKWTYSLAIDLSYKNFVFTTRFIGKADMYRTISGGRIPFNTNNNTGAVFINPYRDHWTPESYSGDAATENPNAEYPRLGFNGTTNLNNSQNSTFWIREASYIKMADVEVGYNFNTKAYSLFRSIYAYVRADNVFTLSDFRDWNPEQNSSTAYPLKRTISLGFEIGL